MGIKRHKPAEIVTKLRQVEVLVGQGLARLDAIREVCIPASVSRSGASRRLPKSAACPAPSINPDSEVV